MAETAINFPPSLMREQSVLWRRSANTVSPGQSGSGAFNLGRMDGGGLWLADWADVSMITQKQVLAWRAIAAAAEEGIVPIILPMCERRYMPAPVIDGVRVISYGQIPHSDDAFFSDDSGYYQPVIAAVLDGDTDLRATTLRLNMIFGSAPQGGERFTIVHTATTGQGRGPRLYEIKTVVVSGTDFYTITFLPPLRDDTDDGTPLDFDTPRCVMRLARPDSMALPLDMRKFGRASPSFVEYFYAD